MLETGITNKDRAINFIKFCQKTHEDWAVYFEKQPELEEKYIRSGEWDSANEHRRIIEEYNNVLACLT